MQKATSRRAVKCIASDSHGPHLSCMLRGRLYCAFGKEKPRYNFVRRKEALRILVFLIDAMGTPQCQHSKGCKMTLLSVCCLAQPMNCGRREHGVWVPSSPHRNPLHLKQLNELSSYRRENAKQSHMKRKFACSPIHASSQSLRGG